MRYPGSKAKLVKAIRGHFPASAVSGPLFHDRAFEYIEPFVGAGAVFLALIADPMCALSAIPERCKVRLNDRDWSLVCWWRAIQAEHERLVEMIERFVPSVDAFRRFKEEDGRTDIDPVRAGFQKLALHQMSYSGIGAMAGGPLGGFLQSGDAYTVDCRWNADREIAHVLRVHRHMKRFADCRITCGDFAPVIKSGSRSSFVYADPPYYKAGPALYKYAFSDDDHRRLARCLRESRARWLLSYDDHPFIRDLYSWATSQNVDIVYTSAVARTKRRKNSELLIAPNAEAA